MDLSIDISALFASFVFGVIGFWMWREGRRQEKEYIPWIGVGLMAYPYFVDGAKLTWGIGMALCSIAYYIW